MRRATAQTMNGRVQGILIKETEKNVIIEVSGKRIRRNKNKHNVIIFTV